MTNISRAVWLLAVLAGSLLFAACQDTTAPADTGALRLELVGLPPNVEGAVRIERGSAVRTPLLLESSVTEVESGVWTVTASIVHVDGIAYVPEPMQQLVTVAPGRSGGSARVVWTPTTGSLRISVTGLPAGGNADVTVTGPNFSRTLTGSAVLTELVPGTYVVASRDVQLPSGVFATATASQSVTVSASAVPYFATVSYVPAPAVVEVDVTGLPGSTAAAIALTSPDNAISTVQGTTRLSPALVGLWRLAASSVTSAGNTYTPSPSTREGTARGGDTLRFPVAYSLSSGSIAVAISGLPQGATGSVTVLGPNGFSRSVTSTTTVTGLAPGQYTVQADDVVRNGFTYRPAPPSQQVAVTASLTASPAQVTYSAVTGTLVVSVSNVPNGATGNVRITGPNGFDRTISSTTVFSPTATGSYTISAAVIFSNSTPYDVTPSPVSRTVSTNGRDSVDMRYENAAGSLQVTIAGLPNGVNAAATLTGGPSPVSITSSTTIQNLAAGNYSLSASSVTDGGTTYNPTPTSQGVTITRNNQSSATITYTAVSNALDLILDYAYLTQATQKSDGTVGLVAGRDALLRVFAHADRNNTVTTTVRARIYDGATLLQTITINGPILSVPLSVDEGSMNASWNTVIAGANIRTATHILVDIDPNNTTAEGDETNNIWPRNGTPQSVTVNTVPNFTVRFVPVTVGTLTGNVTVGNMNSFLSTTRRVWPLGTVVSDVRLPFISSADSLVSNDSNTKWLTVLSEINTLKSADNAPSTMHYYGVVKVGYSSGVAGYGYVPGRAAVGWDYLPSGNAVAAHEWGHNFNRPHAPCGTASGPDPQYPYAGGIIGVFGWNSLSNAVVPTSQFDLMGYCNPTWVSDYSWSRVMTYRQSAGAETTADAGAAGDGLLVWGRVSGRRIILEPAFRVRAPATLPSSRPTHVVDARDADGNVLMQLPFAADVVDHVDNRAEQQFAIVLPWTATLESALTQLRVRDVRSPLVSAVRTSDAANSAGLSRNVQPNQPLILPDPDSRIEPASSGRVRVRWNASTYAMAMIRDVATGQVMGYVRNSGTTITTGGRTIEMVYSDGVRSVTRR